MHWESHKPGEAALRESVRAPGCLAFIREGQMPEPPLAESRFRRRLARPFSLSRLKKPKHLIAQ